MQDFDQIFANIEAVETNLSEAAKDLFSLYAGQIDSIDTASTMLTGLMVNTAMLATAVRQLAALVRDQQSQT